MRAPSYFDRSTPFFVFATLVLALSAFAGCESSSGDGAQCYERSDCGACERCDNGVCAPDTDQLNACGLCAEAPTEQCDNGVDDDCDGAIDEDCEPPGCAEPVNGDGCCPEGATKAEDDDCPCADACGPKGATACEAGELRVCETDALGCRVWSDAAACADGFCTDDETCGTCEHGCPTVDETTCADGQIRVCGADANGCRAWGEAVDCPSGFCGDGTSCGTCDHGCPTVGESVCEDGSLQTCRTDDDGCRAWSEAAPCPEGFCASESACGTCDHGCARVGEEACDAGRLRVCEADENGCRSWGPEHACADGFCVNATTCGTCDHGCPTANATVCDAGRLRTCETDENGCRRWSGEEACADGFCVDATTCGTCSHGCESAGDTHCEDGAIRSCAADEHGCRAWTAPVDCVGGFCETPSACGACDDGCESGTTACEEGSIRTCLPDAHGCLDWSAATACEDGFCASPTTCGRCEHGCAEEDATECHDDALRTCVADERGCRSWSDYEPCGDAFCADGATCGVCDHGCPGAGITECVGGQIHTCVNDGDGCRAWGELSDCAEGFCGDDTTCGSCDHACESPGAIVCAEGALRRCTTDDNGCRGWSEPEACDDGYCQDETTCGHLPVASLTCPETAGIGEEVVLDASGSTSENGAIVRYEFDRGDGGPVRANSVTSRHTYGFPGAYTVRVTVTDEFALQATASCIIDIVEPERPDLVVRGETELCGEHYLGQFTVESGARIRCPSGILRIDAVAIDIAAEAEIDMTGSWITSPTHDPADDADDMNICAGPSYCSDNVTGAGGGGATTAGEDAIDTIGWLMDPGGGCGGEFTCRGADGGPQQTWPFDLSANPGTAGGRGCDRYSQFQSESCLPDERLRGGRGGGVIQLVADELVLRGELDASAENGSSSSLQIADSWKGAGSGGGGGGSVLLVADRLDLDTGLVRARNGYGGDGPYGGIGHEEADGGDGGIGSVKALHGGSWAEPYVLGTLADTRVSVMPPLRFHSPTHPDGDHYYGDGFDTFTVEWEPPFESVSGYYYLLQYFHPVLPGLTEVTPENGTYTVTPRAEIPADVFPDQGGSWHLLVVSVDADGTVGTVANRFTVKLNQRPHQLSSTTHPDQDAWYPETAVALTWEPHSATSADADDFEGFWYRLDTSEDVALPADRAGWTYTESTELALDTDADGAPLAAGIYHFHLVAMDTQGVPTRQIASYRLQLGEAPTRQ